MTVFLRSATMIVAFIVILLIAVFWHGLPTSKNGGNLLPVSWKSFFRQDEEEPVTKPDQETSPPASKPSTDPPSPAQDEDAAVQFYDISGGGLNEPAPVENVAVAEIDLPEEYVMFKKILEQEYGATDILLEPWGNDGKMYRFSCYVPQPKGSGVKKLFQKFGATPTLAIQEVLEALQ